jgi:NADP-dependent 3-hydroxy acid dehydrogenase YdfG
LALREHQKRGSKKYRSAKCRSNGYSPAEAVARAIAYAIEQPDNVDLGDIMIRPSVQG